VVPHPPQTLVPSFGGTTPSAQLAPPAGPTWCLTPRKPFFLRPEAPRPQLNWRRRRGRRGASSPANPCSFVRTHHAPEANSAAGGVGVVPHPPQSLIPSSGRTTPLSQTVPPARTAWCLTPPQTLITSSGGTTPSTQMTPPAGSAWCLTPRKSLFLRPEAPRP